MMDAHLIALMIAGSRALGVVVWVLAKIGKALVKLAEALAAAAVVFFAMWLIVKGVVWAIRQLFTHWRTSLTLLVLGAACNETAFREGKAVVRAITHNGSTTQ